MDTRGADRRQGADPTWAGVLAGNLLSAVAYAALGTLALLLVRDTGLASPVWPSAGLAFAIIYAWGLKYVPAVFLGSLLTNVPALARDGFPSATELGLSIIIAIGATLAAVVGAMLVRHFVGARSLLGNARDILLFLALAGPVACAVSASVGTLSQVIGGVDVAAGLVNLWLTWWVGDVVGVIVFAPIVLMLMPSQIETWRGRRWKVAGPSIIVLVVAVVAIMQNASLILTQRQLLLRQEALDSLAGLQQELTAHQELLDATGSLRAASDYVSQEEFGTFTASFLSRHPDLQAVSWNPIVSRDERPSFESSQQGQAGLEGFEITERDANGTLIRAADRPEYVTVAYIEPLAENQAALGFDVYSNDVRADAIDRARASKTDQVTAPIDLVQETGTQKGVLLFHPTFDEREEVDGFSVGVYRLGDLLNAVVDAPNWSEWNYRLIDATPGEPEVVMAERVVDGDSDGAGDANGLATREVIDMGGRTWVFEAWPSQALIERQPPATPMLLLLGTGVIAFLLEAFLLLLSGNERQWRREADSSTHAATHDELTGIFNRRGFFRQLEGTCTRAQDEGSTHVLMYCDLDGFKLVNDSAGHDAGDAILQAVAREMQGAVRERDTIARLGGDEFGIIVHNCPLARGEAIADAVQRAVSGLRLEWNGQQLGVGVSIGVTAIHGASMPSVDELMRQADQACYEAKRAGKGVVCVFVSSDD